MDILIIGEDPLKIHDLVELIVSSPSYPRLAQNWKIFVQSLEGSNGNNLDLEKIGYGREQLRDLLTSWSAEKGSGATLSVLCDALNNCQVEDISELLEKKYWLVAVKSLRIKLHERIIRLEEVSNQISEEKYRSIYNELKSSIYTQPIELFREDLIPKIVPYYIPRTLHPAICEDDLLKIAQKDGAVIISDSPGMGKSLLLANLARKVVRGGNTSMAIFIFLDEFVGTISDPSFPPTSLLAKYATKNEVNKLILEEILKNGEFNFDLFLDAYDEVSDIKDGLDFMDKCLSEFMRVENFKIYVTTRPHFRTRLEKILSATSYEILPFSKTEQIQCILKYWAHKNGGEHEQDETINKKYAEKCLEVLTQQFQDGNQEIAGIPLHCMLLAQVFLVDVRVITEWPCWRSTLLFRATSLFIVFKTLVEVKFRRISQETATHFSVKYWLEGSVMTNYFNAHVYESLLLLFPEWIETFEPDLKGINEIDENTLYSIGLLKMCQLEGRRKFVDRRYAEYILAEYLIKNLTRHHDRKCFQMLFKVIYQSDGVELDPPQFNPKINKIYGLKHPVTNYFVDMLLDDQRQYNYYPNSAKLSAMSMIKFEPLCKTVELCALHNLEWSLRFTTNLLHHLSLGGMTLCNLVKLREKYFRHLPFLVAGRSNNVKLVRTLMEFMENTFGMQICSHKFKDEGHINYPWLKYLTPLHMAVYKGNYDVVSYFVTKYEHEDQLFNLKYLLHMCVRFSVNDNDAMLEEKLLIIEFLLFTARGKLDWLNEKCNGWKPSEVENVHPRLHEKLLELEINRNRREIPVAQLPDLIADNGSNNQNPVIVPDRIKLLGTGGSSAIYEGKFGERAVAVKVMRVCQDDVEKVKREIETLIKCDDHDNIVKYLCESHSESNEQIEYLLAMELCESDLKEFIRNIESCLGKWNIVEIPSPIEILRQITDGLSHVHSRNEPIIHRDLKPENILVKVRQGKIVIKLTDFGISNVIPDGKTHHTARDFAGTPGWIAPELMYGRRSKKDYVHLTLKADIFSLGCVFWYVLSNGQHPFPFVDRLPSFEPKLEISSHENQFLYYGFLRLILFMIEFDGKDRPSIEDTRNHPIFWPAEKRLLFLTESVDFGKLEMPRIERWLKSNYLKLAGGRHSNFDKIFSNVKGEEKGWLACISDDIEQALQNKKSPIPVLYRGKSFTDLLTVIRNLKAHIREKEDSVKKDLWQSLDDFINYWHSSIRFPFLFDFVWTAFQSIQNPMLQGYYEGVKFNFTQIMKNENQFVI